MVLKSDGATITFYTHQYLNIRNLKVKLHYN